MQLELRRKISIKRIALEMTILGIIIGVLFGFTDSFSFRLVPAVIASVVAVTILYEVLYRAKNYVTFNDKDFHVEQMEWGLSVSSDRNRVPYRDIIDVRQEGNREVVVTFGFDPTARRLNWPHAEYHGRTAIVRFEPENPRSVLEELEWRRNRIAKREESEEARSGTSD